MLSPPESVYSLNGSVPGGPITLHTLMDFADGDLLGLRRKTDFLGTFHGSTLVRINRTTGEVEDISPLGDFGTALAADFR